MRIDLTAGPYQMFTAIGLSALQMKRIGDK